MRLGIGQEIDKTLNHALLYGPCMIVPHKLTKIC